MSVLFTLYCPLCKKDGPTLRCSAGGTSLNGQNVEWDEFMMEHEWHGPLGLCHEQSERRPGFQE